MEKLIYFELDTTDVYNLTRNNFKINIKNTYSIKSNSLQATESNINFLPGDKIFFLPGVNIPRVKLKDIVLDYNIKIVRDITQATKVFSGTNTYNKISENRWYYSVPTKLLEKFIDILKAQDLLDGYNEESLNLIFNTPGYDTVITDYNTRRVLQNADLNVYYNTNSTDLANDFNKEFSSCYANIIESEHADNINYIIENSIKLYDEKDLLDIINGDDALVINEETYEKLSNMFRSSDDDNHTVAMEIMSNSKYKESLFYLELLFYNFSGKMRDNKAKNHVNFKSLITYLNKEPRYLNTDVNDILQSLVNKKVINEEYLDKILKMFEYSIINSNRFFLVKSVTINSDIFDIIKQDYTRQVFPDREVVISETENTPQELDAPEELSWI